MPKTLTDAQVTHFREQGWLAPLRAMDAAQAADCAARISAYEAKMGESANRSLKIKGHLAMPWLVELGRNPAILDALEDLMGPDIMLFGASIFAKGGKDRLYVSWHQDSAYFGLEPHEEITAWVAFNQTTVENGALQVLPRTHLGPDMVHEETYAPDNMLARGQSLRFRVWAPDDRLVQ
ncbi:MAG: phytanoyl-CoA dioxygenase family protein, partial [Nevskiales bacterium]